MTIRQNYVVLFLGFLGLFLSTKAFIMFFGWPFQHRSLLIIYFCSFLTIAVFRKVNLLVEIINSNKLLFLFLIYAILSTTWSEFPYITFRRSIFLILTTFFGGYIAKLLSIDECLKLTRFLMMIIVILCIFLILFFPEYGIEIGRHQGDWRGIFPHKNHMGRIIAFGIPLFLFQFLHTKRWRKSNLIFFLLSTGSLAYTGSRTSWILTFLLTIFIPLTYILIKKSRIIFFLFFFILFFLMILIIAFVLYPIILEMFEGFFQFIGRDATLTGRTQIWNFAISRSQQKWLLGHGYNVFWLPYKRGTAHFGYLDLWLDLGFLGFGFLMCVVLVYSRKLLFCFREIRKNEFFFLLNGFFYFIIFGFTNLFVRQHQFIWLVFIINCFYISRISTNQEKVLKRYETKKEC